MTFPPRKMFPESLTPGSRRYCGSLSPRVALGVMLVTQSLSSGAFAISSVMVDPVLLFAGRFYLRIDKVVGPLKCSDTTKKSLKNFPAPLVHSLLAPHCTGATFEKTAPLQISSDQRCTICTSGGASPLGVLGSRLCCLL